MEGKRGSARALRAALAALLMIALALTLTACGGKKIDASSLISVRFQGLNGDGRAVLAFDRDKLIAALSQDKALTERQMETLERLASDLQKDYSVSKREGLSNGDTVEVTGALDKNLLKDLGFGINNDTVKVTVEGLIDPLELSATDFIVLETAGFNGYGRVSAYFDGAAFSSAVTQRWAEVRPDDPLTDIELVESYRNCSRGVGVKLDKTDGYSNGDAVTATVTVTGTEIPECGITFVGGEYSGVVSGLAEPETVDVASAVKISFDGVVPTVRVKYEVDHDQPFVRYTSLYNLNYSQGARLHNGDTYTLEIECDEAAMLANGFIPSNTTATATVEGLNSYDFSLADMNDPLLSDFVAEGFARVEDNFNNNYSSLQQGLLDNREGWVQWDGMNTRYAGEALAIRDDERGVDNELYLIYRTQAPVKRPDGTVETGTCYTTVYRRGVMLTADNALTCDNGWNINRYATLGEVDQAIADGVGYHLGEGAVLTRSDAELEDIVLPESDYAPAGADTTAEAVETCAILDMVTDYASRIETWETMTDPYGANHENVLALSAGSRARADYQLDGRWDRFTGTLCTYNEAGTEAQMSLYVWGDDRLLYKVDGYQRSQAPAAFAIDVSGVDRLSIQTACYGRSSGAWLFICDGQFESTGEAQALTERRVPLSDAVIGDMREIEDYSRYAMTVDAFGNAMRDGYRFNSDRSSVLRVNLGGAYTRFTADVATVELPYRPAASARLDVLADGAPAATIGGISMCAAPQAIDLDVTGVNVLEFRASTEGEDGDRVYFVLGNTLLTGPAQVEAEVQTFSAADAVYADIDYAMLAEIEGEDALEEPMTLASDNYLYLVVNKSMDYAKAKYAAQRIGGVLAMPKTNRQNAALAALLDQAPGDRYWLGARRQTPRSETWVWNDGEIMTDMSNWNSGEPSNTDGRENTLMTYSDGSWNDIPGDNEMRFVVQFPAISGGLPEGLTALGDLPRVGGEDDLLVHETYDGAFEPALIELRTHRNAWISLDLGGAYATLTADLRVHPDSDPNSRATVAIYGDGKLLYQANNLRRSDPRRQVSLNVAGVHTLKIMSRRTFGGNELWIDLPFTWLTQGGGAAAEVMMADAERQDVVDAMTLEAVDAKEMELERALAFDAAGGAQPGWIALDAADEGYVMYNLGGAYTTATGAVCTGEYTAESDPVQVRVYVDGQLVETLDDVKLGEPARPFEVDLTGASTLRFETSDTLDNWQNLVYLAGLTLK